MAQETRAAMYERTLEAMCHAIRKLRAVSPDFRPCFALPPDDVAVFACIDQVPTLARNADARQLLELFCAIGVAVGGPNGEPTVLMLRAVLEQEGIQADRVSLDELGIAVKAVGRG